MCVCVFVIGGGLFVVVCVCVFLFVVVVCCCWGCVGVVVVVWGGVGNGVWGGIVCCFFNLILLFCFVVFDSESWA